MTDRDKIENLLIGHCKIACPSYNLLCAACRVSQALALLRKPPNFPEIVCLCGSTRFMDVFFEAGWKLTLEGKIVLSVGVCKHAEHHGAEALGQDIVDQLDELHLRKIDLADSVMVLNVGGYIGESTSREIQYAKETGKPIVYLEPPCKTCGGSGVIPAADFRQGITDPSKIPCPDCKDKVNG